MPEYRFFPHLYHGQSVHNYQRKYAGEDILFQPICYITNHGTDL